ncbi:MAG: metal ABC transporter permease [Pseudomonadota bacterium]
MVFSELILPFQFPFMQNAFALVVLVAIPTAMLSCFLVLKGWALMGDAVSHAVLPGIVVAYVAGIPLLIGAFIAGMFCALATGYLDQNSRVKGDTVMGVVFSGMFGLGLVLYVWTEPAVDLDHILFGNMLGVQSADLWLAAAISLGVGGMLLVTWKDLLLHAFDPAQAKASGLYVNLLHHGLLTALSLTIVATLSAAGLILAIGLLIAPGATALLLARRFPVMLGVAVVVNLVAMVLGTYLSFFLDSAPAPTIILVHTAFFVAALSGRLVANRRVIRLSSAS